jgi:hypothetical protein
MDVGGVDGIAGANGVGGADGAMETLVGDGFEIC